MEIYAKNGCVCVHATHHEYGYMCMYVCASVCYYISIYMQYICISATTLMKREATNLKKNKGEGMCERAWKDEEKREIM